MNNNTTSTSSTPPPPPAASTPSTAAGTQTAPNLLQNAASNGSFKTFGEAVAQAGLSDALSATGPFTVFAPTDAAFEALPAGKLEFLYQPENKAELVSLLNYHVLKGRKPVAEIGKWQSARTLDGGRAPIRMDGDKVCIDGAVVTVQDIDSSNGYLHGIDKVNVPTIQ